MLQFCRIQFLPGQFLQSFDILINLISDVFYFFLRSGWRIVVYRVDQEHRHIKLSCQIFKPFCQLVADIVAAKHKIRFRHIIARCCQRIHVSQIDSRIGADIHVVALSLCVVQILFRLVSRCQACCMILRIHNIKAHCLCDLLRENGCGPSDLFSPFFGCYGILIQLSQLLAYHNSGFR